MPPIFFVLLHSQKYGNNETRCEGDTRGGFLQRRSEMRLYDFGEDEVCVCSINGFFRFFANYILIHIKLFNKYHFVRL